MSSAARLFESALSRVPDMSAPASSHFETLLKARAKKPKPQNPVAAFDRPAGSGPDDFTVANPHMVEGTKFKLLPNSEGKGQSTPIHPTHADYNGQVNVRGKMVDMSQAQEYTAKANPLEPLARIGHRILKNHQEDLTGWQSPNHRAHPAYIFTQLSTALHPETSTNVLYEQKKARGMSPKRVRESILSGQWAQPNQAGHAASQPQTFDEHMDRIHAPGNGNASNHAANLHTSIHRFATFRQGLNRYFHVAKKLGEKFHGDMDHGELHDALMDHHLGEFSGRRTIPGMTNVDLTAKHNTMAAGDFDKKGKPTWKPDSFFGDRAKSANWSHLKFDNPVDAVAHLGALPIGDGRNAALKNSKLVQDYLPDAAGRIAADRKTYALLNGRATP